MAGRVGLTNIDVVDVSCVNVNYAGVYQLRVAIQVDGALKFSYYAVQVVTPDYADNPLVATYGTGAINDSYSFSLDAYGRAVISANGVTYGGYARYNGDQFVVRAFASDGSAVTAEGKRIASGIVTFAVQRRNFLLRLLYHRHQNGGGLSGTRVAQNFRQRRGRVRLCGKRHLSWRDSGTSAQTKMTQAYLSSPAKTANSLRCAPNGAALQAGLPWRTAFAEPTPTLRARAKIWCWTASAPPP